MYFARPFNGETTLALESSERWWDKSIASFNFSDAMLVAMKTKRPQSKPGDGKRERDERRADNEGPTYEPTPMKRDDMTKALQNVCEYGTLLDVRSDNAVTMTTRRKISNSFAARRDGDDTGDGVEQRNDAYGGVILLDDARRTNNHRLVSPLFVTIIKAFPARRWH